MWRYYLAATALVAVLGSVLLGQRWYAAHRAAGGGRAIGFAGSPASGAPTFGSGQGTWVMSALPDCFDEQRSTIGASAVVGKFLPPARERIAPGSTLRWNDCTVRVGSDDVRIERGSDRLRVPPQARLYAHGAELILVWRGAAGRTEIRDYARSRTP